MVWQLYEWQQRQQFRHGSPTAPIYTGPNFTDSASFRVTMEMPRSVSVPPSPCEVPPSVPCSFKPLSPRRPHTPSERRSVKPLEEMVPGVSTRPSSPSHICAQITQVGHWRQVLPYETSTKKKKQRKRKNIISFEFQVSWVLQSREGIFSGIQLLDLTGLDFHRCKKLQNSVSTLWSVKHTLTWAQHFRKS